VVAFLQYLKELSFEGFIIAGAVAGPNALKLDQDLHQVVVLAISELC